MTFINHPEVDREIDDAAEYYDNARPGYGLRFIDSLRSSFARIADAPDRWPIREFGFRKYKLPDFPHTIRYLERTNYIYVVAVHHSSRKPGFWKKRVSDEQR